MDISLPNNLISLDPVSDIKVTIRKTSVEINEELLEAVRKILGTKTVKETVEKAFREVVSAEARREEIEALETMRGMDLDRPDVMGGAWRS